MSDKDPFTKPVPKHILAKCEDFTKKRDLADYTLIELGACELKLGILDENEKKKFIERGGYTLLRRLCKEAKKLKEEQKEK